MKLEAAVILLLGLTLVDAQCKQERRRHLHSDAGLGGNI